MSFFESGLSDPSSATDTTLMINRSNPTIVGTWRLKQPSTKGSTSRMQFNASPESLGPDGDRRVRVARTHFMPGGKYRGVCKLKMRFVNRPNDTFGGTGWLISDSIVVTAGHCIHDWQFSGSFLKEVKIYFGYNGPDSVNESSTISRAGVAVAVPAEYLKAPSYTHDVGFIQLDSPVYDIVPVNYVDTPLKTSLKLGVVGFPIDLDGGNYMYEDWRDVDIDLARTGNLLNYKIDTTGGQSGAPVFSETLNEAIAVHVAGGWPNIASTIGPVGNTFGEYLLALKVMGGFTSSTASIVTPATTNKLPFGFTMVRIDAVDSGKQESGLDNSPPSPVSDDSDAVTEARIERDSAVTALFGGTAVSTKRRGAKRPTAVAKGVFLEFPESLRLDEAGEEPGPAPDFDRAVAKATDNPDIDTVFFINFPIDGLDSSALTYMRNMQDQVMSWQAWSSTITEGKVQEQINKNALPGDNSGASTAKRSTYRAKVFDYLMRNSSWFAKTFEQLMTKKIEVKTIEFHTAILTAVLEGFMIPTTVFGQLEKILQSITNGIIKAGSSTASENMQYWIMLTRYKYYDVTKTVLPTIRIISFQVNQKTAEYTFGKSKYSSVSFDLSFVQTVYDFNSKIYAQIQAEQDKSLVDMGLALMKSKGTSINVPVDP